MASYEYPEAGWKWLRERCIPEPEEMPVVVQRFRQRLQRLACAFLSHTFEHDAPKNKETRCTRCKLMR